MAAALFQVADGKEPRNKNIILGVSIMKRAVIYVRTSSEHQGAKASPDEQEADCRKLAAEQGIEIVKVYRDTERYRAKKKLVDPSGTRTDRPGLVAMLEDAAAGQFNVILAWREDRLYRGLRAMLLVLDVIQEYKITIMLAKENFDAKIAPLKAWVAQMELEGMRERMSMGVKARLKAGKANTGQDRYGYRRARGSETIEIVEEEAFWVRKIFSWYIQGVSINHIRDQLIAAGATQKGGTIPRQIEWSRAVIQGVLIGAKDYASGIKIQRRDGEAFEISIPPIIDQATYQQFLKVREGNNKYPARHLKHNYLIGGLLYCSCGREWRAHPSNYIRQNRRGDMVERKTIYWTYLCPEIHMERISQDCPRSMGVKKADAIVWEKVCNVISNPDVLLGEARWQVTELMQRAESTNGDRDRIQKEVDTITLERQRVITWARKGVITDEDMEYQLSALTLQEMNLKRELATYNEIVNMSALKDWEQAAREYFLDLQAGIDSLNHEPETEEEKDEIFKLKRDIVKALINRITINKRRELQVEIKLNVLAMLEHASTLDFNVIQQAGTYTRKQLTRVHPHPVLICG